LRNIIQNCDLVNADGMPIVWASRLLGKPLKERVAGVDLFIALVARAAYEGWPIYLLGAQPEVIAKVKSEFLHRYPNLKIAGSRDGYWSADQESNVIDEVCASGARLLFVAISSPKKELLLSAIQARGVIPFSMGVGGSFDVVAGKVNRAPLWMQHNGLEWFFRFLQEPRRLFKRYFFDTFWFAGILFAECWLRVKTLVKPSAG
jgi:N-acetylglucosaminyldiphosphoundecaprenol N-acetyl-beta-D-mannosaminyltransferase